MNIQQIAVIFFAMSCNYMLSMEVEDAQVECTAGSDEIKQRYFIVLYDLLQIERTLNNHPLATEKYTLMEKDTLEKLYSDLKEQKDVLQKQLSTLEQKNIKESVDSEVRQVDQVKHAQSTLCCNLI